MRQGKIVIWAMRAEINAHMEEVAAEIAKMAGEKRAMSTMLIFEEVFVNVANYSYRKEEEKPITVECVKFEDGAVRLTFRDRGIPFNINNYHCKKPQKDQIGGHGIRLIRELSDSIEYRRSQFQNITTITIK